MKVILAVAGCVFAVCSAMFVMDSTAQTLVAFWHVAVIIYVVLSVFLIWMFGFCHGMDPRADEICRKWLRPLHLVTAILIWPLVSELVLQSSKSLWFVVVLLLWHTWIEWAYKKVSK